MNRIKGILTSLAGMLICFAYLAGVVGFDIHIDHHEDRTYVVSLLNRTDCESIHPEDHCHCCDHHHGECEAEDEDCENIIDFLEITGDGDDAHFDDAPSLIAVVEIVSPVVLTEEFAIAANSSANLFTPPPREHLSRICVLRV